jgi:methylated-DNA-[protein]-cysteine S-methyltransferase
MQEDKHCTVVVPTMLGRIMCVGDSRAIYSISLRPRAAQLAEANDEAILPPLMQEARRQLEAYFAGKLTSFDLPYRLTGTPFQRRAWKEMAAIGFGRVRSYGEIAKILGNPGLARAVGGAANRNPLPLVVP